MRDHRLVIFCAGIEADLGKVRAALRELGEPLEWPELLVSEAEGPGALHDAGWQTLSVSGPTDLSLMEAHLEQLVQACAQALGEEVLCVYVDQARGQARAALQAPGGFPRSAEGELFHVLRHAATWVETEPVQLLRFFGGGARSPVDVEREGLTSDRELEAERDEDDMFVEAKLKLAHELMLRYRSQRK